MGQSMTAAVILPEERQIIYPVRQLCEFFYRHGYFQHAPGGIYDGDGACHGDGHIDDDDGAGSAQAHCVCHLQSLVRRPQKEQWQFLKLSSHIRNFLHFWNASTRAQSSQRLNHQMNRMTESSQVCCFRNHYLALRRLFLSPYQIQYIQMMNVEEIWESNLLHKP